MTKNNILVTASVVLFNTPVEQINKVIASFTPGKYHHLYFIDNSLTYNSEYDFLKEKDNITYIFNHKNLGYGTAHNIGLRKAIEEDSKFHIILNPDISFNSEIIDELVKYNSDNEDVGYILPKVLYPDGRIQYLCKLLPTPSDLIGRRFLPHNKKNEEANDRYILKKSGYDKIINPPCLSGCFMFLNMEIIKKNQIFFDEKFFMYLEDFDFMRRLHRVSKTIFYPYVSIIHDHKQESYHSLKMTLIHIKSAIHYFNKYGWFFDNERKIMNDRINKEIDDTIKV